MRKKIALLELAIHSLKHKLKDIEYDGARKVRETRQQVEREKDMEMALREIKIKQLFDVELRELWIQKENIQKTAEFKDKMMNKLV
jgi:hypothetical protein